MNAREEILGRVRANLAGVAPAPRSASTDEPGRPADLEDPARCVTRFRELLESVGGRVTIVRSEDEAREVLARRVRELGATRVVVSDAPAAGRLVGTLSGARVLASTADRAELLGAEVGVTSAQWGIAETGTLVLLSDHERSRLASLLPAVHVALLDARCILPTLGAALAAVHDGSLAGRTVTFVTGPSRTADIELTLVVGVHGPRELDVLLLDAP